MKYLIATIFFFLITQNDCENFWRLKFDTTSDTANYDKNTTIHQSSTELHVRGLQGTLHYETLLHYDNVSKLKIFDNRLTAIEPGAICSSASIKSVEINFAANPEAPSLTKDVFRQCHLQLQELFIRFDFDNPSQIHKNALEELSLRALGLQCYKIGILSQEFLNLKKLNLTRLALSSCYIHTIDGDFFDQMLNLEEVEISFNRNLTHLPNMLFTKSSKLRRLFLQYNRIRELEWDEFSGLTSLEELDLSGNRLAFFDAAKISETMPGLRRLKILKNLWPCKLKKSFANDLEKKMKQSVEVVYTSLRCRSY